MDFEQYRKDVFAGLEKWINTLTSGNVNDARELKENVGDLVSGWKDNWPRRRDEIESIVVNKIEQLFKDKEPK